MTAVHLFSSCLLSKWGFNDGDAPDDFLDWLKERGLGYSTAADWRDRILPELVRRHLLPKIKQDVTLVCISTNHNPIRAETVNGVDVTDWWTGAGTGDEPELAPEYVEVPYEEVLKIAQEA